MSRFNTKHGKALEKIALNPEKFDFNFSLSKVRSVQIETNLYHKGRIHSQPDITFELISGHVYLVEYKSNGDERLMDRARTQLGNALWWYGKHKPEIDPEKIHTRIISGTDYKFILNSNGS